MLSVVNLSLKRIPMKTLRILVADDHEVVRLGLVSIITSHPGWEVCAEAENGRVAVDKAKALKPDVAILDIGMPTLNGLEATHQILRDNPRVNVLILTVADADGVVRAALDAGARGFLLKSDAARDLVTAIEALQFDKHFLHGASGRHRFVRLPRKRARYEEGRDDSTYFNLSGARGYSTSG
jgi:DNA-binding NarL/FixJ family response regulator